MTSSTDSKIELLINRIKYAPSREWINSYFDLVKRVLDITGLKNDDPRLLMSLSPNSAGWHFPVTINFRYVVALQKKNVNANNRRVGIIFNSIARDIIPLKKNNNVSNWGQFGNLRGETSEPPYFLQFNSLPELIYWLETSKQVYQFWQDTLLAEVKRAKASPYRKYHEPLMTPLQEAVL